MRRLLLIPLIAVGVAILSCEQQAPQAPDEAPGVQLSQSAADVDRNGNCLICSKERQAGGGGKKAAPKRAPHYRDDVYTEVCDKDGECEGEWECPAGYDPVPAYYEPECPVPE